MRNESLLILSISLALVGLGSVLVFSAGAVQDGSQHRLVEQGTFVLLGLVALALGTRLDYHVWSQPWIYRMLGVLSIALLCLVLIPGVGVELNGARRWILLGGIQFQPSEIAKFALVVILAVKLARNHRDVESFERGFVPVLIITGVFSGLILLEKDLGGPVVLGVVAYVMMFVAGIRLRFLVPSVVPIVLAVAALVVTSPHRMRRMGAFLDPWSDPSDTGYHLIQSLAGFARGGIWGVGPGAGEQKLHYLYAADSDFVFAVWGEEMGLIGTLALASMFVVLAVAGLRVAAYAKDAFGGHLATGIVTLITLQAGINMAVTIGLLPTKGLTLPLISAGGTSLIAFMAMLGVLINVALQGSAPRRVGVAAATNCA